MEVVKSELAQSIFNATLAEMEIVNIKGAETNYPIFHPKTISIFSNTVHFANA